MVEKLKTVGSFILPLSICYLATVVLLLVVEMRSVFKDDFPLIISQASTLQETTIPNIIKESQAMRADIFVALDEAEVLVDKADKISEHAVGGVIKGVITAPGHIIKGVVQNPAMEVKAIDDAQAIGTKSQTFNTTLKNVNKANKTTIKFND